MAASYTLTSSRFPDGTTVYANPVDLSGEPVAAVVADGSAVFQGLREYTEYLAHATIGTPDVDGAGTQYVQASFTTGASNTSDTLIWDGSEYVPASATEYIGPVNPATIDGISFEFGDQWTPTEEPTE